MTPYQAVSIAEGFEPAESDEQVVVAWQYLVDSGLAWKLQGWFGRTASDMIEQGILRHTPARKRVPNYNNPILNDMPEALW